MAEANTMREKLIAQFTEGYMEKIFYFCLKKTGNGTEAEDLTGDIALSILAALNGGVIPTSFSAWVWKIARNRYAVWADRKHRTAESLTGTDIGDEEIADEGESALDKLIRLEQLALLRRELAFIRSEYRKILVAYYHEEKSMRDIAASLSLSVAAVKQRLYRARNILKEGMNMAREFGVRSYKPEDIHYSISLERFGKKDQPKSIMEHSLYANILLEAYGTPSTAEELSLELGVALPYMEDELEYLTRETMLIKKDGKYQTSFPIISCTAQEQIHTAKLTAAPGIAKALTTFVDRLNELLTGKGYEYYSCQDYESAKWTFLMLAYQRFENRHLNAITARPDDGQWDIIGYQQPSPAEPCNVWNTVRAGKHYALQQFRYVFKDSTCHFPETLTGEEAKVIHEIVKGELGEENAVAAAELEEKGYLRKKGDGYEPAIPVIKLRETKEFVEKSDAEMRSELSALSETVKKQLQDMYCAVCEIIRSDLPTVFSEETLQCAYAMMGNWFAGYIAAEALRQGDMLPPDKVSPVIGACIELL